MTPLNRIDMTRYPVIGWRTAFLAKHGFRIKIEGNRVFMVRDFHRRQQSHD